MKIYKELDNTNAWVYTQEKNKQKKEYKMLRNMRQSKRDTWNNAE